VDYAAARHITVIPEIEMPGHAQAAIAAYPELACTPGPFEVSTMWGVDEDILCPSEATFAFLEGVLTEVMALFPGPYIHIGGDEAPKARWKSSELAQSLIRTENLKNEEELQSWFTQRIERFLNAHGRRLIGWDEILEGGLAPDAVVMSWRGTEGGEAAAQQGHDVVMTPESHCYLNRDQGRPEQEPTAVGGYLPLEKVYAFEPTPTGLAAERARHILGLQGNLWTERVTSPERVEYMVFPRLAAIAEVGWTASRDWERFASGLGRLFERFERQGVHAARSAYAVGMTVTPTATGAIEVRMTSAWPDATLRYTVDSKEPGARAARYRRPLLFSRSATVKAALFDGGKRVSGVTTQTLWFHAGVGRPIVAVHQPSAKYRELAGLVDGLRGSQFLGDGRWVGFEGPDMVVTVDLGRERALRRVSIGLLQNTTSWIFFPRRVELELSADGSVFHATGDTVELGPATLDPVVTVRLADVAVPAGTSARYVRVRAESVGVCPSGHPGEGQPAWVFADELVIE
jgi:hexosaminidase